MFAFRTSLVEQTSLNPMASLSSAKSSDSIIDWATVLSKSKSVLRNGALDFHPQDALSSKTIVEITAEDVSLATNKWNCAVIAQILGDNSSLEAVQKFAEAKWNDFGLLEVQKLDNELFIFRFKSEESKNQVLEEESLVFYGSKMMYSRPWVPNKPIEKLSLLTVPIWIKLPGLGLQYFTVQALSKLGSLIGRPLFADKDTIDQSKLSYARMCVEIKADDDKLPNTMVFKNEFGVEIVQEVEYEWVPPRCTFCKLFGHDTNLCTRHCVPDLEAHADSPDSKSGQLENITAENEEVDLKAASGDEEKSENNKSLLPEKMRISRNKACPCGSKKKYKACCGFVDGRSSCNDEGECHEKKGLLPEEKSISRNKACPCGSKKKYRSCCKLAAGGSSEGESQENLLLEEKKISRNKPCPCGSVRKYKKCCGATFEKIFSRNKGCPCGSTKEYDKCCGSVAEVLLPVEDEWIICA